MTFIREGYNVRMEKYGNLIYNFQIAKEQYYPIYVTVPVRKSNDTDANIIYLMKM